jgi:hypothetical protein
MVAAAHPPRFEAERLDEAAEVRKPDVPHVTPCEPVEQAPIIHSANLTRPTDKIGLRRLGRIVVRHHELQRVIEMTERFASDLRLYAG